MNAAQTLCRQEKPPARDRVAACYVRLVGIHFGESELGVKQSLIRRRQQPFHRFRLLPLDGMFVIVEPIAVEDAKIALRVSIAPFGGLEQPLIQAVAPSAGMSRRHRRS
jgi:hypothetical protein